jgi:Secretion system C-terminal sorting domain
MVKRTLFFAFIFFPLSIQALFSQDQTLKSWFDSPVDMQGQVNSIVVAGNTAYLGGHFAQCGFSTGYGVAVDTGTADADHYFPKFFNAPGGWVSCAVSDSQGGWYIGGAFTSVNGQPHKNLAHIRADKTVDPWDPAPDVYVTALYFTGTRLYVGGVFDSIAGQARGCGAAFDNSGNLLAWDPRAYSGSGSSITAIQPVGGRVYIGGYFYTLGGQFRMLLGAVDSTAGNATNWNPTNAGPSGSFGISKFIYSDHQIYLCGSFSQLNGVNRICIAKMDENGVVSASWNPGATITGNDVSSICLYGGKLYAAGDFSSLGGQNRNNLVALDTITGLATAWIPATTGGSSNNIRALGASGSKLFIGGNFTSVGSRQISYLAAIDTGTGTADNWNPGLNNVVFDLTVSGSTVYAGGYLTAAGLTVRNNLAAIDLSTGRLKSWNPNADGAVNALAFAKGRIYAGGSFSNIGGAYKPNLAFIDTSTGTSVQAIPAGAGGYILALASTGNRLYAAGNYGLVAYNLITGSLIGSFHPTFDYSVVTSLCPSGNLVYAGGYFSTVNGQSHPLAAAFDTATDLPTSWSPNLSGISANAIAISGSKVYIGGQFSTVNGQQCASIAAIDAATGSLLNGFTSSFTLDYKVSTVAAAGNLLYIGGQFSPIGNIPGTSYIATLNAFTGAVSSWRSAVVANEVTSIVLLPQSVFVGGSFITMLNTPQINFAALNDTSLHSIGIPKLQLVPKSLVFGPVALGAHKDTVLIISNIGTDTLRISSITSLDPEFISKLSQITLPPQQSIMDSIRFTPATARADSSFLLFSSNSSPSVDTALLKGTGMTAKFVQLQFSKQPISFGAVHIASWRDSVINISNNGNDTAFVNVTTSDSGFIPVPALFAVTPGGFVAFTLRFKPSRTGEFAGIFILTNSRTTPSIDTIDVTGLGSSITGIGNTSLLPKKTILLQNYPNPFNPTTVLTFQLAVPGQVTLKIFNSLGKEVAALVNAYRDAGTFSVSFDASSLASGIYFSVMKAGGYQSTKKMILLK